MRLKVNDLTRFDPVSFVLMGIAHDRGDLESYEETMHEIVGKIVWHDGEWVDEERARKWWGSLSQDEKVAELDRALEEIEDW